MPGGGGHSYSKVDMMLVHGRTKWTLNKYFRLKNIPETSVFVCFCYPKQVSNASLLSIPFFLSLLWVLYSKHVSQFQGLKNIPFFFQMLLFLTPFSMYVRTSTVGKNDPFMCLLVRASYLPLHTSCPPWKFGMSRW